MTTRRSPIRLAVLVALALGVLASACGDASEPPPPDPSAEDCDLTGDEDGNGAADCADPACAALPRCRPACGNGRVEAGETCDDGNTTSGDGCDNNCTVTGCGNGVLTMNEGCDDGNTASGDGCDNNCIVTGCGNGIATGAEACDDGNVASGDGCDNNCTVTACGNGVLTPGEVCDDGNVASGDGCDNNCTATACGNGVVTGTESCDDGNVASGDGCDNNCTATACGNGVVTMNEGCDDGNTTSGDGCDANCKVTGCGNGVVTAGEACDDGNTTGGDGCDNNCTVTACGNGVLTMNEGCDDGNTTSGDGCDANCKITGCGNGVVTAGEACDDGNTTGGDGCDNNCQVTACGNGVITMGEACDDGNTTSGDGCDANCQVTACGNGVVTAGEACDDGNPASGDGCSAACVVEPSEHEPNEDGSVSPGGFGIDGNDFASVNADANGAFTGSVTIRAALAPTGDEDVFKFTNTGTTGAVVRFDLWNRAPGFGLGASCGTSIDTGLQLRTAAGASAASNDNRSSSDRCSGLDHRLYPGQTIYAHVTELGDNAAIAAYALQTTFTRTACGNGTVEFDELCDDGNTAGGDGCSALCRLEGGVAEIEPNEDGTPSVGFGGISGNDFASANANANGVFTGTARIFAKISPAGDEDVFAFTNPTAVTQTVRFDVWNMAPGFGIGVPCGTSIDLGLTLLTDFGAELDHNDNRNNATDRCPALKLSLTPGQTIYAHVVERDDNNEITTPYALDVVSSPAACGDGVLSLDELCDDGNLTGGDGCSSSCILEGGVLEVEPNDDGTPSIGGGLAGNDFATANADANGAFTGAVRIFGRIRGAGDEDVFAFRNPTAVLQLARLDIWSMGPGFGIGVPCGTTMDTMLYVRDAAGVALAGNFNRDGAADTCSTLAFPIAPGETVYAHLLATYDNTVFTAPYALDVVYAPIACGNGAIGTGEECDDGNTLDGDGCSALCRFEPVCGDGAVMSGEQCDDGNTAAGDGCSATCQIELVNEVEPNDTLAQAAANPIQITGDTFVRGSLPNNLFQRDLYRITVTTGTVVRFEAFDSLVDCQGANINLQLLDAAGAVLREDIVGDGILACSAIVAFLAPGTYFIEVETGVAQTYFLEVDFQSDRGAEPEAPGVSGANDTAATAAMNLSPGSDVFVSGDHTLHADGDFYAITVPAGARIRAQILEGTNPFETCAGFDIYSRLTLRDQNGAVLADSTGFCSIIDGTGLFPASPGARNASGVAQTYYLQVRSGTSSPTDPDGLFSYRLQLTIR